MAKDHDTPSASDLKDLLTQLATDGSISAFAIVVLTEDSTLHHTEATGTANAQRLLGTLQVIQGGLVAELLNQNERKDQPHAH